MLFMYSVNVCTIFDVMHCFRVFVVMHNIFVCLLIHFVVVNG